MNVIILGLLINQVASQVASLLLYLSDPFQFWVQIATISVSIITIATIFLSKTLPWLRAKINSRSIKTRMGAESYTSEKLFEAFRNFIHPMCQDENPSVGKEPIEGYKGKRKIFSELDEGN